jgi:hypothetical protein
MELVAGLIGALLGATAVIGAQIISARATLKSESEKQRRSDIATATRSLLRALQTEQWLVWKAVYDPDSLTDDDLTEYNKVVNGELAAITGDLGVLSATWPDVYGAYARIAAAVFTFDQQIAEAIVELRVDRQAGVERMVGIAKPILRYHWFAYEQVRRVVKGRDVEKYDSAAWTGPRDRSV